MAAKSAVAPAAGSPVQKGKPLSEESIRAYLKWEGAGNPAGQEVRFWLEAEQELLQAK
jgi:hypothetical protein